MEHLNINVIAHHIGMLQLQLLDAKAEVEKLKLEHDAAQNPDIVQDTVQ